MASTRTRLSRRDVLAPANAVTVTGALLTLAGAFRLNSVAGLVLVAAGRILDVIDGPVARRTHSSRFGALLDATADKLAELAILGAAFHFRAVPVVVLALIFIYQLVVAAINIRIERRGRPAHSTVQGKQTMFLHIASLLLFVWASLVAGTVHIVFYIIAVIVVTASGWFALRSIKSYTRQLSATTES